MLKVNLVKSVAVYYDFYIYKGSIIKLMLSMISNMILNKSFICADY